MTKKEQNVALARKQAETKLTALQTLLAQIQEKEENLQKQKKGVIDKISKIEHYLQSQ